MAYKMIKITILFFHITIIFASSHFNNDISSKYDVEILRDSWGVPHIYGTTDEDVAFGFAFAHSEDDFKTIHDLIITHNIIDDKNERLVSYKM